MGQRRFERDGHKSRQLCKQVERRLSLVFSGELVDPLLEGLAVVSVTPVSGASVLKVEVSIPHDEEERRDEALVLARLTATTRWLRSEIAEAINRKRTPQLIFSLASSECWDQGEG